MCFFDADPCDFYNETYRTVRAPRHCDICNWMMPSGAPSVKHAWKHDGYFHSARICLGCDSLLEKFSRHHGNGPTPDWFLRALRECFEGADKKDPDAKLWRDAVAEILRRGRASMRVTP